MAQHPRMQQQMNLGPKTSLFHRTSLANMRSVAQKRRVAQEFCYEVLFRSLAQTCCSEVSIKSVAQKMPLRSSRSEASLRRIALIFVCRSVARMLLGNDVPEFLLMRV